MYNIKAIFELNQRLLSLSLLSCCYHCHVIVIVVMLLSLSLLSCCYHYHYCLVIIIIVVLLLSLLSCCYHCHCCCVVIIIIVVLLSLSLLSCYHYHCCLIVIIIIVVASRMHKAELILSCLLSRYIMYINVYIYYSLPIHYATIFHHY